MKCLGCGENCRCKNPTVYTTWPLEGCLTQTALRQLAEAIRFSLARNYKLADAEFAELKNLANNIESALERTPDDLLA